MASSSIFCSLLLLLFTMVVPLLASSHQFQVGGDGEWAKPAGNSSETYNDWASENRFHVGDTIYFKYQNDSVLVVKKSDYKNCVITNPISEFRDGKTVFRFDRYGFFYFISGQPGHCNSGQRLIIRVMVHPEFQTPQSAPAPKDKSGDGRSGDSSDSFDFGPPRFTSSSNTLSSAASCYFMTALAAVCAVILYLFV